MGSPGPKYYRLDLAKLENLFRPDVPFSEWCVHCQSAGPDGFPSGSLRSRSAPPLSRLAHFERICGTLLYINISGAAGVWLVLALLAYARGWPRCARLLILYTLFPFASWALLCRIFKRSRDARYDFPYRHQHSYLHMKYVWPSELHPTTRKVKGPLIFCIVPHGVLPFGIDYAMIDKLGGTRCNWVAAPILFKLPFIRWYLKRAGVMPAKAQHIRSTLAGGSENVGVVLDGVAGIFQPKTEKQEAAWLLERKGIVKMALETGASLVPIYGFGHTSLLSPILDPFRILERISIALDVSLVPFVGRWGWPMGPARRIPVVMAAGQPVECPQTSQPKQSEIDLYHTLLLDSFKDTFNTHKAAYGWSQKSLMIV